MGKYYKDDKHELLEILSPGVSKKAVHQGNFLETKKESKEGRKEEKNA